MLRKDIQLLLQEVAWPMYEEEEIIDGADQKAIYDEMKWDE